MTKEIVPTILVSNEENWLGYCLESIRGFFSRIVVYDIGSTDRTREIIQWYIDTNPKCEFYVKYFPMIDPKVQGTFRNSMIAETLADYYLILDGDEIYQESSLLDIIRAPEAFALFPDRLYGVVRRVEIDFDIKYAWGVDSWVPHHRLYHRRAIWTGSHPGEVPYFPQEERTEMRFDNITCWHFHNTERSSKDAEVPKRLERRKRPTYRPGEQKQVSIFRELPLLRKPIANFPVNPELKKLQDKL